MSTASLSAPLDITLVIGSKNHSSWSLRPWLALAATGAPFREELILLDRPDTKARIAAATPHGLVPALRDGDVVVWESLAICEYLAERFPEAQLWPADRAARATARAVSAEMHAGFAALRRECPMNLTLRTTKALSAEASANVARVRAIWRECRARFGAGGPWLFGRFSIADCMFAPVATRFRSYGVEVDGAEKAWCEAMLAHPSFVAWEDAANREPAP